MELERHSDYRRNGSPVRPLDWRDKCAASGREWGSSLMPEGFDAPHIQAKQPKGFSPSP